MYLYDIDDKVVYANIHEAVVVGRRTDSVIGNMYEIKFNDYNLIPPVMEVKEKTLRYNTDYYIDKIAGDVKTYNNTGINCPKCGDKWNFTEFGIRKWFDCLKCNKTKEQIMKERP